MSGSAAEPGNVAVPAASNTAGPDAGARSALQHSMQTALRTLVCAPRTRASRPPEPERESPGSGGRCPHTRSCPHESAARFPVVTVSGMFHTGTTPMKGSWGGARVKGGVKGAVSPSAAFRDLQAYASPSAAEGSAAALQAGGRADHSRAPWTLSWSLHARVVGWSAAQDSLKELQVQQCYGAARGATHPVPCSAHVPLPALPRRPLPTAITALTLNRALPCHIPVPSERPRLLLSCCPHTRPCPPESEPESSCSLAVPIHAPVRPRALPASLF